jgi:predicted DNA-binding transcriptional regulator YafY
LNRAWGIVHGTLVTVKVVFARDLARYVADRLWHPSQKLRTLGDGRLEVTLRVADTLEVRRWILGYGTQAEVVEPHALREALRREAEGLARALTPRRPPLATATPRQSVSESRAQRNRR